VQRESRADMINSSNNGTNLATSNPSRNNKMETMNTNITQNNSAVNINTNPTTVQIIMDFSMHDVSNFYEKE
jgi:hypothetical protein